MISVKQPKQQMHWYRTPKTSVLELANREPEINRSWGFMRNWKNNELEQKRFFDAS